MKVKGHEFAVSPGGKEIFKNNLYPQVSTLQGIISDNKKTLEQLISVKIVKSGDAIEQYTIETQKLATNITTYNGLDFFIMQYDKATKKTVIYSPYSNPGYDFFAHLLCAYFEVFKHRPLVNFTQIDIDAWNKDRNGMDNPLRNEVMNIRRGGNIFQYLSYKKDFKQDSLGITRSVSPNEEEHEINDREGFGLAADAVLMKFSNDKFLEDGEQKNPTSAIVLENELLPLYLQAFIDTNRRFAGARNATNLKKIYEMIYYVLENKNDEKDIDFVGARKNTPLTSNK